MISSKYYAWTGKAWIEQNRDYYGPTTGETDNREQDVIYTRGVKGKNIFQLMNKIPVPYAKIIPYHHEDTKCTWIIYGQDNVFPDGRFIGKRFDECDDIKYLIDYYNKVKYLNERQKLAIALYLADLGCCYIDGDWMLPKDSCTYLSYVTSRADDVVKKKPLKVYILGMDEFGNAIAEIPFKIVFKHVLVHFDEYRLPIYYGLPNKFAAYGTHFKQNNPTPIIIKEYHFIDNYMIVDVFENLATSC